MIKSRTLPTAFVTLATSLVVAPAFADHFTFPTRLSGYNETPSTLNSPASGEFLAKVVFFRHRFIGQHLVFPLTA